MVVDLPVADQGGGRECEENSSQAGARTRRRPRGQARNGQCVPAARIASDHSPLRARRAGLVAQVAGLGCAPESTWPQMTMDM